MSISQVLAQAAAKIDSFDAMKAAVGRALTEQQQLAVSAKLSANPAAFIEWLGTDAGKAATRVIADAFASAGKKDSKPS